MSHTHASVLVHCVFSTKGRLPLIQEPQALWRYLAVLAQDRKIHLFAAGGTANHVHLLIRSACPLPGNRVAGVEGAQLAVDTRARSSVCLAGRIWRVQREPGAAPDGDRLHWRAGRAPSKVDLRAGVYDAAQEGRTRLRSSVCFRIARQEPLAGARASSLRYPALRLRLRAGLH